MSHKEEENEGEDENVIRKISGTAEKVDYEGFMEKWGLEKVNDEILKEFEEISGGKRIHRWLRRGLYVGHRDFDKILRSFRDKEDQKSFYLFTGMSPTRIHLGHYVIFRFTKYLQDVFQCPVIIQLADDEKYYKTEGMDYEDSILQMYESVKDLIAIGFDVERTFIFSDFLNIHNMIPVIAKIRKILRFTPLKKIFGFKDSDRLGKITFPPTEISSCFSDSFPGVLCPPRPSIPILDSETFQKRQEMKHRKKKKKKPKTIQSGLLCLIPAQIDQDPYFRLTRDIAKQLGYRKPSVLYSRFIGGLKGNGTRMSSKDEASAIFMDDSKNKIKKKVYSCFSGGQNTKELQRKKGANVDIDVSIEYLELFLEDDLQLEDIRTKYSKGELLTGEVKIILRDVIQTLVGEFQKRRSEVTPENIKKIMEIRRLKM